MEKFKLFTTVLSFLVSVTTLHAQALKVSSGEILMSSQTIINNLQAADGLDITTKNSTKILPADNDLIWGSFYQLQPNNPGIFSLTSLSSPSGWSPCFTVRANGRVGIMNDNPSVALEIGKSGAGQTVKVNGTVVWGSDTRLKQNIRDLSQSLSQLNKLRSVSYELKQEIKEQKIPEKILKDASFSVEEAKRMVREEAATLDKVSNSRTIYGFLAQDVQELFPDLVYEDENTGMLAVDYIGLIPILVDALREQQVQLEEQHTQIASILKLLSTERSLDAFARETGSLAVLHQNTPNPFTHSTEIGFYIPESVQTAQVYVYDVHGVQKKSVAINTRKEGSVTIDAGALSAGLYFYTLICDGKPIDSKQMILTR